MRKSSIASSECLTVAPVRSAEVETSVENFKVPVILIVNSDESLLIPFYESVITLSFKPEIVN